MFRKWSLSDDCVPQLDKLRSLSKTSDCTYSDILFNHYFYQGFITDRAITEGNLELQGNECLKEIFCEPCLTVVLWASFLSDSILCFLFTASVFCCFFCLFFNRDTAHWEIVIRFTMTLRYLQRNHGEHMDKLWLYSLWWSIRNVFC